MSEGSSENARHIVCPVEQLPPGERLIIEVKGRSIGVFNIEGRYYAIRNLCPHQGAPLCLGTVTGTALPSQPGEYAWGREGEIIRCPWHGWEFDITSGRSVFNPHKTRVKTYEVTVETAASADPGLETYSVRVEQDEVVIYL